MKKLFGIFLIICGLSLAPISAQDESAQGETRSVNRTASLSEMGIQFGNYAFAKKYAPNAEGLTINIEGSTKSVETVMKERMKQATGKAPKSFKEGLNVSAEATIPSISSKRYDYYYRVEKAAVNGQEGSQLTFFVSAGNYNFLDMDKYEEEMRATGMWLSELPHAVAVYEHELATEEQAKLVDKETKNMEQLVKEEEKLKKEIEKAQQELETNQQNQVTQTERLQVEQERLTEMKETLVNMKKQ